MEWLTVEIQALAATAVSIGVIHTLLGPDHYLPFVALAKSRGWTTPSTVLLTVICGIGHTVGSIVLGLVGISLGFALSSMEMVEMVRGDLVAYMFVGFGLAYLVYGIRQINTVKTHSHVHHHADGTVHSHSHSHQSDHAHLHEKTASRSYLPWTLFILFAFGPCEALIPILMYPASQHNFMGMLFVTGLFVIATVLTMVCMVVLCLYYSDRLTFTSGYQKYAQAIAGSVILACGVLLVIGF